MKKFTLLMVAGLFALAGSVQAQELVPLTAEDLTIANGETKDLAIKLNYELEAGADALCGASFSLSLPEGIILGSFADKAAQDAATVKNLKKNCVVEEVENQAWGEDADNNYVSVKQKNDGGLLFVIIDQGDQIPFIKTTDVTLCSISLKAIADVTGTAKIYDQAITNVKSKSVGMVNGSSIFGEYTFAINGDSQGINDIQAADATAPAYNLQGVRVNNAAKGVIIREGKKMIVK